MLQETRPDNLTLAVAFKEKKKRKIGFKRGKG